MPVAKSFQGFTKLGEPYMKNNRAYIKVRNEKTGTEREVRWYSDAEYVKLYPLEIHKSYGNDKTVFGFDKGYITVFDNFDEENEWLVHSCARYCTRWGWYIVSTDVVPVDLPAELTPRELKWEEVGGEDGMLLSIKKDNYEHLSEQTFKFDNVELVSCKQGPMTRYGATKIYRFEVHNYCLIWRTSVNVDLKVGDLCTLSGKVKECLADGVTQVYYCKIEQNGRAFNF